MVWTHQNRSHQTNHEVRGDMKGLSNFSTLLSNGTDPLSVCVGQYEGKDVCGDRNPAVHGSEEKDGYWLWVKGSALTPGAPLI